MKQSFVKGRMLSAIYKQIDEYVKAADDLVSDYGISQKSLPDDIKQRYETLGNIVEGLQEAACIIMKCDCETGDKRV